MKVYVDLIFFINFFYDFLLLLTVDIVLKRKRHIKWHLLSAFFGALSIFLLFLKINNTILLLLKILTSIIMSLVSFKFISLKYTLNNLAYLYMTSVILAGFLYYLSLQFSLEHSGLIFFFDGMSINYVVLIIIAPIILYWYINSSKKMKNTYNLYYPLEVHFQNRSIKCLSLFDSGNRLKDPVSKKAVIIVDSKFLKDIYHLYNPIYVKYQTISDEGLMKCFKPSYIVINNKKIYNYLIGESKTKLKDGVGAILNIKLMEDNYV